MEMKVGATGGPVGWFVGGVGAKGDAVGAALAFTAVSGSRHRVNPAYCTMWSDVHVIVSPALRVMVLGGGVVPPYFTP